MGSTHSNTNLANFPPPKEQSGTWPWVAPEVPSLKDPDAYPSISIITPNLNGGAYLEETIRSVLLQAYPRLEYIVMDGGSTDGSGDIIKKYAPWLTYWESREDRGQPHAINKGIQRTNSTDALPSSSLRKPRMR